MSSAYATISKEGWPKCDVILRRPGGDERYDISDESLRSMADVLNRAYADGWNDCRSVAVNAICRSNIVRDEAFKDLMIVISNAEDKGTMH